jgi:2-oxoglutarate dehydrogenase E2 component (dihydrolipoamide succinyltransferase)
MPTEVRIPTLGESVTEGVIVRWIKHDGDAVAVDDPLLELETEKASVEIPAVAAGVLSIVRKEGETVQVGDVVARIETDGAGKRSERPPVLASAPQAPAKAAAPGREDRPLSPAVRKLVEENALDPAKIEATGPGGRLTKEDVVAHLGQAAKPAPAPREPASAPPPARPAVTTPPPPSAGEGVERVPMSRLRQRIAERLVQAQHTAAILTTFNEVDLTAVMELRARHKSRFSEVHGVSLGFMSFFARASIAAIKDVPVANAHIDGTDIVYPPYVNLGIAVSTPRGLVVPVIKRAQTLSFAQLESEVVRLAGLARDGKLSPDDLSGGTFSITNGGVFGSLLSTPILNPPQSAILGMHKIEKRPVVVDDAVVIRPMMYMAVSYDHRLIDGEQAVTFLVRIKERLEDPTRLLLDV